jgi:hypothetical protein
VLMVISSRHLTNWRAELCYSPKVMALLNERSSGWDGSPQSRKRAEDLAAWANAGFPGTAEVSAPPRPGLLQWILRPIRRFFRRL